MNKRSVLASALSRTGALAVLRRLVPWSGVLVLNYHRIGTPGSSMYDHGLWSADPESFAGQIRYLKSHVDVISPRQLPDALAQRRGRYAMVTFDDGYRDNYELALPVLQAEGVKAAFFVATGFIDRPTLPWWDEIAWMVRRSERASIKMPGWLPEAVQIETPDREAVVRALLGRYKLLPHAQTDDFLHAAALATGSGRCPPELARNLWMSWDMVRALRDAGMTIGGHTVTHPLLASLDAEGQRREIMQCCRRLESELGEPTTWFSYPVGRASSFNEVTRSCLREAGIRYAASYYGGYRRFSDWDDLDIRRMAIESEIDSAWFGSIVNLPKWFAPVTPDPACTTGTGG